MAKNKITKLSKKRKTSQNRTGKLPPEADNVQLSLPFDEQNEPVGKLKLTGIGKKIQRLSTKRMLKRAPKKATITLGSARNWKEKKALAKRTRKLKKYVITPLARFLLPIIFIVALAIIRFAPIPERAIDNVGVKALEAPGFPISLVFDKRANSLGTTWIKTPGGVCHIEDTDELNLVSEELKYISADMDGEKDLLWRLDFANQDGIGITLWIGMTTESSKIYICKTPLVPSRWQSLPLKLNIPEKVSLYFSPTTPVYEDSARQYIGREVYTFLYTVTLTQDGPAFVPFPKVYEDLYPIFTQIFLHEPIAEKRAVYKKMQLDFARLSKGMSPSIAAYKNIRMETVEIMTWKK